ncbi:MAG: Ig-like domain-containing protein, partial [Anaerolineales bacterium]
MNLPPRRVPPGVWVGGGVVLGLALAGVYAAPQVVAVTPPPDSVHVPARASLRIEFDRPMDPESAAAHLIVEPRLGGRTRWQGTTMIFEPEGSWPEGGSVVVEISAGARSVRGLPLLRATRWTFSVGGPRIVYLWPAGAPADLQAYSLLDESTAALTDLDAGVGDYHLSRDGTMLVYSTEGETAEIRRVDLSTLADERLYACPPETRCTSPELSPEGARLAFTQSPVVVGPGGQPVLGPSQVWMLPLDGATTLVPIGPSDSVTSMPAWTPHGWLSYYDHTLKVIAIVDPAAGPEPEPFRRFP